MPVPIVSRTASLHPRAAPWRHSKSIAAFASLSTNTGRPIRSATRSRKGMPVSGRCVDMTAMPRAVSIRAGIPMPTARTLPDAPSIASRTSATAETTVSSTAWWSAARAGRVARWCTSNAGSTAPASSFVPPRSTPITQPVATIGHHTGLHAAA